VNPNGKVAIVTGAGTGIGRATAVALAQLGAAVLVVDRDEASGAETARRIRELGHSGEFMAADVSKAVDIETMFAAAERHFGRVDIVHNNAGIIGGEPVWPDSPLDKIAAVIAVNLGGVAMGTEAAIQVMRRQGHGGVIINTASVAGLAAMPTDPVYSATKAGVLRIVESCVGLADSDGIRVNAVLPAIVDTDMTNKHTGDGTRPASWLVPVLASVNLLQPEDIAAAVVALVLDDSKVGEQVIVRNP
jgi:NAD(P)-dependent dehydrogenase (short-subunit alcohol dehydrogenase family)